MNRDADLLVRNINMLSFCFLMCNKFNDMWEKYLHYDMFTFG